MAAPVIEPVVVPLPANRPSIPRVASSVGTDEVIASSETAGSEPDGTVAAAPEQRNTATDRRTIERAERRPARPPAAEPEVINETTQAQPAELARALFAADRALAQGRLTSPPESSAYALYNRVLALDPGSGEAKKGLQSVRQGLINRALAQLAGNALDDARQSLQAAADAGADPMLVADLRGEIDSRQRLMDRAGLDE